MSGGGGYIVESIDEAVAAVGRVKSLDRAEVRRYFDSRFTATHMAQGYVAAYEKLIGTSDTRGSRSCKSSRRRGRRPS